MGIWGSLAHLQFLQTLASVCIGRTNPSVIHNIDKYLAIKKIQYLGCHENMEGDYLEFGVYQGSSLSHAIRCYRNSCHLSPNPQRFFGFDSFCGFGESGLREQHNIFKDENFATSKEATEKRVQKAAGDDIDFRIVPGFFEESLKDGPQAFAIEKARFIFIDSDTYSAARVALDFCESTIQLGTVIMLDDSFAFKGNANAGEHKAFTEFVQRTGIKTRTLLQYGCGGIAYIVSKV